MVHGMEVSTEKSRIMTNSTNNISADISMNGKKLEEVTSLSTWEQPCAKMAPAQQKSASGLPQQRQQWLNRTWRCNTISLQTSSSSTSLLSPPPSSTTVKHGPCLLTLKKKKKDPGFRNQVHKKHLRVSYLEHKTNDWVRSKINFFWGPQEPLLATVERLKLALFGHVTRHDSLSKTVLQGPSRVGDAVVGRGNARWTSSKSGHPCPCQNCSQGPPAKKTGRRSLLNRPSCRPDDPVGQETELN